jgi:hypothetical protein
MTRHDLVAISSIVVAFGYGAFALFLIRLEAPLGPVLLEYVLPAAVALLGGVATAKGHFWGPLLIALLAAMLAIWLVSPLAPLFTAALLAVTGLGLLEAALLWRDRPSDASMALADLRSEQEPVKRV